MLACVCAPCGRGSDVGTTSWLARPAFCYVLTIDMYTYTTHTGLLLAWLRAAEFSCDRAALLVAQAREPIAWINE